MGEPDIIVAGAAATAAAQNLHNNPHFLIIPHISPANPAHARLIGKNVIISFMRSRLPRRLLRDGWWLETPYARRPVIAFPQRNGADPKSNSKRRVRHLTLVTSGK